MQFQPATAEQSAAAKEAETQAELDWLRERNLTLSTTIQVLSESLRQQMIQVQELQQELSEYEDGAQQEFTPPPVVQSPRKRVKGGNRA